MSFSFSRKLTFLLCAVLLAGACTNAGRFGAGTGTGNEGTINQSPFDGASDIAGGPSDPTSVAYFQQSVGDRVFFEVDQSTLTAQGRETLQAQAIWLLRHADYNVVIEGHADEQGTREYNLALGARRADAARSFLISQGVQANRLQVVSFGKERPAEICSQESCYRQNRRAVTVLASGLVG